ncbi:MAG TPA: Y-family DNA polymerase [Ktedonobacteraceae bacterium]|nr:Y-family DNA polymerase [Ktedonobacteraceae bacterium]
MKQKVIALVDCNNFYVSCERVFNARLHNRPVIVLSNNDGCVVARSNESKILGIKMGQPLFQCQDIIEQHNVQVFSSNYSLYADMSARVMKVLASFSPTIESYSIDEAFLDLTDLTIDDLTEFGKTIKARVMQFTGIPVSVGIASSKCLAKVATEVVKTDSLFGGVLDLTQLAEDALDQMLAKIAVDDVWGIGRKYALFLTNYGMTTARDLKYADQKWIRRYLTVVGERIVLELRGISCIPLETERPPKKGIMCSRSFSKEVTTLAELTEAVATYTARAAEKLRQQDSLAASLTVFIRTNTFNQTIPHYSNSFTCTIAYPTAFTPELIHHALAALRAMYKDGYRYKKAGVYLSHITPLDAVQPDLFGAFSLAQHVKQARLMALVDAINRVYGRDTLFLAVQGTTRVWAMQRRRLSQQFTSRWDEILTI